MLCDIEVQDAPTIVTDNEKAIEQTEGDRMPSPDAPPHLGDQLPVQTESAPVSVHHRFGRDRNERLLPSGPESADGDPEELVARSQDVAAVGFSVGFESPSQFSREYKRLFGTPPGKDGEHQRSIHELSQTPHSRVSAHRSNEG
jgi:AraC-like DNA-binding protein